MSEGMCGITRRYRKRILAGNAASTACVLDNEILDIDLSALDEQINQGEMSLRRSVLEHLSPSTRSVSSCLASSC